MIAIPGKIPVQIHPFFWVMVLLIGFSNFGTLYSALIFALIALISVLIHEYGHALTAFFFGQEVQIELAALGGITQRRGPKLKLWQEFLVVLNGPLAGLSFAFISYAALLLFKPIESPFMASVLSIIFQVNVFWTIVNLIPIQPLDGGQLLRIFFETIFGLKGLKMALFCSMVFAGGLGLFCLYLNQLFMCAILLIFMFENYRNWRISLEVSSCDQDVSLQQLLNEAEQNKDRGRYQEALQQFAHIQEVSGRGMLYVSALQNMAEIFMLQDNFNKAFELLSKIEKKLPSKGLKLLQLAAFKLAHYKKAIEVGTKVYQLHPDYDTALTNALSHAILGESKPAIGWLQCAIREGLPSKEQTLARKEFNTIRNDPKFKAL